MLWYWSLGSGYIYGMKDLLSLSRNGIWAEIDLGFLNGVSVIGGMSFSDEVCLDMNIVGFLVIGGWLIFMDIFMDFFTCGPKRGFVDNDF